MNRDLLLNHDTAETIQGHVGQRTKQVFDTLTAVPFSQPRLKLAGYEFLLRDQFGNHYHKMRAVLFDGELYDADQFIKPSMMMKRGGGHADLEDKAAKARLRITEALLKDLREEGALILARKNVEILRARSTSTSPVAIETKDISHQANLLEDALRSARQSDGMPVHDAPTAPDGFQTVAEKCADGSTLEGPRPGEVFATEDAPDLTPPAPADKPDA